MQNPGDNSTMDPDERQSDEETESEFKNLSLAEHRTQSRGEPIRIGADSPTEEFSGNSSAGSGMSRSAPAKSSGIKGILKNRDMRSPIAPDALNYNGPVDGDTPRDNNYDEDEQRFSQLVDSRELYARKVRAGLVKKRYRSTSTESAPELTFYPRRQTEDKVGEDSGTGGSGQDHRSPPSV